MGYRWLLAVTGIVLLLSSGCNKGGGGVDATAAYLDALFATSPVFYHGEEQDTRDMDSFSGDYPAGWPPEITIPADTVLLNDGEIFTRTGDDGGTEYVVSFVSEGDPGQLEQELQAQAAAAGFTAVSEEDDSGNVYALMGVAVYTRENEDGGSFSYSVQRWEGNPTTFWRIAVSAE